jgi:hypothetical protein
MFRQERIPDGVSTFLLDCYLYDSLDPRSEIAATHVEIAASHAANIVIARSEVTWRSPRSPQVHEGYVLLCVQLYQATRRHSFPPHMSRGSNAAT